MHAFDTHEKWIKYVQDDDNACILSSIASALFDMNKHVAELAIVSHLLSYLSCDTVGFMNRIKFYSDNLTYCVINKGEQRCHYKLHKSKNKG